MGGYIGRYSRSPFSVFNEEKNYLFGLTQEGIPVTDDDQNDSRISAFTQVRRMAQLFGDYGTPNGAFLLDEDSTTHAVESFTATDTITLEVGEGDVSAKYPVGLEFEISGSAGGTNDGTYTVASAPSATPTVITTVETTITTQLASPAISTLNVNNFNLITSQGPLNTDIELAGRFFMRGIMCLLLHDVGYQNTLSSLAEQSVHPRVTNVYYDAISHTVVEDSAANWVVGELTGRFVTVDGNGPFEITSNTADEFKIATDVTADIDNGDHYILALSTPGAPRTDDVYLNVYIDEYDSTDDPTLEKNLGGNAIEAQLRAKVIQTLFVREGGAAFADYVDSNGNQHFVFKIATMARDANNTVTQAEITNFTPDIGFDNVALTKLTPLRPSAKSPAAATIFVTTGQALSTDGTSLVVWPGGDSPTFPNTHATDDRIDVVVLKDDGTLEIIVGTPDPAPTVPAFYGVPVAIVAIASTGGGAPVIDTVDITDARTIYTPSEGLLKASPQFPTANTVYVAPGQVLSKSGTSIVSWAGGSSPTFPVVVTNPRKDVLVLKDDGTLAIVQGAESGSPVVPEFFDTPIAIIDITETSSVIVDADDLTDARTLLTPPPLGLTLRAELSGEAALSAVTVGESGCDFTTIDDAITYVNGLTRSESRQCAIYLFESRNANTWTISASTTIPSYTHLIGMGKPTIEFDNAVSQFVLSSGSVMKNLRIEVTATPSQDVIYANGVTRVEVRNVDFDFSLTASSADHTIYVGEFDKVVIDRVNIDQSGTHAIRGIKVQWATTATMEGIWITNCRIELIMDQVNASLVTHSSSILTGIDIQLSGGAVIAPHLEISGCSVTCTLGAVGIGAATIFYGIYMNTGGTIIGGNIANCVASFHRLQDPVVTTDITARGIVSGGRSASVMGCNIYMEIQQVDTGFTCSLTAIIGSTVSGNFVRMEGVVGVLGTHNASGIFASRTVMNNFVEMTIPPTSGTLYGVARSGGLTSGAVIGNDIEGFAPDSVNISNSSGATVIGNCLGIGGAVKTAPGGVNFIIANNTAF